jgi:hypothetical protein
LSVPSGNWPETKRRREGQETAAKRSPKMAAFLSTDLRHSLGL